MSSPSCAPSGRKKTELAPGLRLKNESYFHSDFIVFSATVLSYDEVETADGSILQGEILTIEDNNLTILTEFAGKLKIPIFEYPEFPVKMNYLSEWKTIEPFREKSIFRQRKVLQKTGRSPFCSRR